MSKLSGIFSLRNFVKKQLMETNKSGIIKFPDKGKVDFGEMMIREELFLRGIDPTLIKDEKVLEGILNTPIVKPKVAPKKPGEVIEVDFDKGRWKDTEPEKFFYGGFVEQPELGQTAHGSEALASRTRLAAPGSTSTTSTGLNYLLAEDNDNQRVPFSKGKGVDLLRRGFLKTMGAAGAGIAALKTGLLSLGGKKATKEVAKEIITTPNAPGKPEWFDALVTRVIREGDDVTKTMATKDREIVYRKKIDDETEVMVTQDLDEGVTRIDIEDSVRNVTGFDDPPTVSLQVTDEIVEEGGVRTKPQFKATENDYRNYATDPDGGYETEFVENTVENTKDLTSDLTKVKSFATKKGPTMKEIVGSKKRKDNVKYAQENPSSYAADRGPDYDPSDYIEDMADDFASGGIARMLGE